MAQLWQTEDGSNWQQIPLENVVDHHTYGSRTTTEYDGDLTIGTASSWLLPDFTSPPSTDFPTDFAVIDMALSEIDLASLPLPHLDNLTQGFAQRVEPDLAFEARSIIADLPAVLDGWMEGGEAV